MHGAGAGPVLLQRWARALCGAQCQQRAQRCVSGVSQTSPTSLAQVLKLEELLDKSTEEVTAIWLQYHSDAAQHRVGSVLDPEEWRLLQERGKKSPMFILPLSKPGGYVTLLTQMQLPFALVTPLEEYKRHGSAAPACMTITHYAELLDSKRLVLTRGDIVDEKLLSAQEARTVLELLRAFYCSQDYTAVQDFNHNPGAFDFGALLKQCGVVADAARSSAPEQ